MEKITHRSAEDVLDDHLRESQSGSVEDDLARNYAEDVVLLTGRGVYHGHDGLRELARMLREELPDATFDYRTRLVAGEIGFLEWTALSENARVHDGADSYLIRDGRIVAQTIHYTVQTEDRDHPVRDEGTDRASAGASASAIAVDPVNEPTRTATEGEYEWGYGGRPTDPQEWAAAPKDSASPEGRVPPRDGGGEG